MNTDDSKVQKMHIDELIDGSEFTLAIYNICSDLFRNIEIPDVGVKKIKDVIYSEVKKARVSELYDVYGILTGDGDIEVWTEINGIQLRIPERINQLIEGEKE